jgi:hypothetical protein
MIAHVALSVLYSRERSSNLLDNDDYLVYNITLTCPLRLKQTRVLLNDSLSTAVNKRDR